VKILINILITFTAFALMEAIAWLTHKYIMHGILWSLHKDHHYKKRGRLQRNDLFFLFFAIPSGFFIVYGIAQEIGIFLYSGIGILFYGITYFIFPEVFFHRRLNWFNNSSSSYLKAMRKAHLTHHKQGRNKEYSCFGMLVFPIKYYK